MIDEADDAGLLRTLRVDPAVEETLIRAGIYPRAAQYTAKVKINLDKKPKKVHNQTGRCH